MEHIHFIAYILEKRFSFLIFWSTGSKPSRKRKKTNPVDQKDIISCLSLLLHINNILVLRPVKCGEEESVWQEIICYAQTMREMTHSITSWLSHGRNQMPLILHLESSLKWHLLGITWPSLFLPSSFTCYHLFLVVEQYYNVIAWEERWRIVKASHLVIHFLSWATRLL